MGGDARIYIGSAPAPDPTITSLEDNLVVATRGQIIDGFTARRSYMTNPNPIHLRTNYFKINTAHDSNETTFEDQTWYRYEVSVTGAQDLSRQKKHRLLEAIVADERFAGVTWATDYNSIIVTTGQLELGDSNSWEKRIAIPSANGDSQTSADDSAPDFVQAARTRNEVTFRVAYNDSFSLADVMNYLRSPVRGAQYDARVDVIQLFNIIMSKAPHTTRDVNNVGQNKFYLIPQHPDVEQYDLGGGLEALRGYYASVRPFIGRLLLNLNVANGAFYKAMPLVNLLSEAGLRSHEQREAFIRMLKVKVIYKKDGDSTPPVERIKTIVGFAKPHPGKPGLKRFGNAREITFEFAASSTPGAQKQDITVFDYFRQQRGITLNRPDLPVLNVGTRTDPQYIPPELCHIIPGQPYRRFLAPNQTTGMINFAVRTPNANAMSIAGDQNQPGNALKLFGLANTASQSVNHFGFGVDTQMITVQGKILPPPQIKYKDKQLTVSGGSWNCANRKFVKPGRFGTWQVLVINRTGNRSTLVNEPRDNSMPAPEVLFKALGDHLKDYGIAMGTRLPTRSITLNTPFDAHCEANDQELRGEFVRAETNGVNLLFVVLPETDKWLYARIKFHGDVKFGIHTIGAVGSKLQKPLERQGAFMGNLALKFNIKGGGVSHEIPNIFAKPALDDNTMVVGIDVTHPSPGSATGAPSISCVVASTNSQLFQWPGSIRAQTGRQEMVDGLDEMIGERLKHWQKLNKRLPGKIVVYRDGVSESQYDQILTLEIPRFEEAFEKLYGEKKNWPKMTVIVVGKRHHTRFYPTTEENKDARTGNPLPGTVVDRGIVGRVLYEFYLQTHASLKGTARPAHYVVIKDDILFEADALQKFTKDMCHLFNRATKAVSICPPAYYADLLCERGRCYRYSDLAENNDNASSVSGSSQPEWTRDVHERLKDSTWYI